jgi:hypothetical protein
MIKELIMKKFYFTLLAIIIILSQPVNGQYGKQQAGLRAGYSGGIFYQLTSDAGNAEIGYNVMLSFNSGIRITGLRIIYGPALTRISPDLFLSWGYGGHLGFISSEIPGYAPDYYDYHNQHLLPVIGADGWGAIEYRFGEIPVNISLNIKPNLELAIPYFIRFMPVDMGLSVAYVF